MREFFYNDRGQLILITCISVVIAIVLMATYEYSALVTGEESINRENKDSFYYYQNLRDRYTVAYKNYTDLHNPNNITVFEKEFKEFALLHGYSVDFKRNDTQATIIFVDKDIIIVEVIKNE